MTIRNDLVINWEVSPRIIEVAAPSENVIIQDLLDTLRYLSAQPEAMDDDDIVDASGKDVLSSTELVGLTLKLFNAKVKFEDRTLPTDCDISGGNLVAVDAAGYPMNPIQHSQNVTVTVARSSSATMTQSAAIDIIKAKTDNLPTDPATQSLLQNVKDVVGAPHSPSIAADLYSVQTGLDAAKGVGWTDQTLKKIEELIESLPTTKGSKGFSV